MSAKSCATCVFNLPAGTSPETGENFGVPMCAQGFGPLALLGMPTGQVEDLQKRKAEACGMHTTVAPAGMVRNLSMSKPEGQVFEPLRPPVGVATAHVTSCMSCTNMIPAYEAAEKGLLSGAICAAKGIVLPARHYGAHAMDCNDKRMGPAPANRLASMRLFGDYAHVTGIGVLSEPMELPEPSEPVVEPTTYPTDKDVTEADKALGIRAWRKLTNPDGENEVFLPVFNLDFFTEEERDAIPRTGDDEHPEQYVDHQGLAYKCAVLWMHLDETPALWGEAGTGKTEFFRFMAWLMVLPFHRISVTGSTEVEDLAGKMHYEPTRGTYFEYGRIPRAWKKPGVICLDEPNVGPPDVWQFIRPLTDNSKQLVLDMNNGERVARHDSAFLGLAMNPAWDVRNSGTSQLADADGSRLMHIFVELPDEKIERKIIRDRCMLDGFKITAEQMEAVIKIAKDLRSLAKEETIPVTWGIRSQIKVARALRWFTMPQAYRLAAADYLEPEHQDAILDVVRSHTV